MRYLAILATLTVLVAVTMAAPALGFGSPAQAAGNQYYVDSVAGSDSNNGTSTGSPWKSLSPVNSRTFQAGDQILLKRGSSFSGMLTVRSAGVTVAAYGEGERPKIVSTASGSDGVKISANNVTVRGLYLQAPYSGVRLSSGYSSALIEDNEMTKTGLGVMLQGTGAKVIGNYIHDLHMVVNTNNGSNDDFGANGVMVDKSSGHEIAHNRFVNNRAPSYDYGYDGGAVELWGSSIRDIYIHHNYSERAEGFLEQGGGDVTNIRLERNESRDYAGFVMLHLDTSHDHGGTASGFVMDANTIVRSLTPKGYRVLDIQGTPTSSEVMFKNNLVYSNMSIARDGDHGHTGNKYFLVDGAILGCSLGSGESQQSGSGIDLSNFKYENYFGGTPAPAPTAAPTSAPAVPSPTAAPTKVPTAPSPTAVPTTAPAAPSPTTVPGAPSPTPVPAAPSPTSVPGAPSPTSVPAPSPTAVPSTGGEILENGDFSDGKDNWYLRSEGSARVTVQSGALEFKGKGSEPLARQDLAVRSGQTLQIQGSTKIPTADSGMSVVVELKAYDSKGNQIQYWRVKEYSSKIGDWAGFKNTVTMPSNAAKIRLQIRAPQLNGTAYFDNLSIR